MVKRDIHNDFLRKFENRLDTIIQKLYNKGMEEIKTVKKSPVPFEFRKEGMLRKLMKFKSGVRDVAIYEVIKENWSFGTGHRGYEVLVVKYTTKDQEFYGSITPAGSPILPSNEQFGQTGWHFLRYESAEKKFNELLTAPLKKGGKKSNVIFI